MRTQHPLHRGEAISPGGYTKSPTTEITSVEVWDPLVRYGHWALGAFAISYLSAEEESGGPNRLHVMAIGSGSRAFALRITPSLVAPIAVTWAVAAPTVLG